MMHREKRDIENDLQYLQDVQLVFRRGADKSRKRKRFLSRHSLNYQRIISPIKISAPLFLKYL